MLQAQDPILLNDWHPVATADRVVPGVLSATQLLGHELVLWRDAQGQVHAWADRCPHRGTRYSIGRIEDDQIVCAYHGWRFAADGRCSHIPAQPDQDIPRVAHAQSYRCDEAYGLVWVCLGKPACALLPFSEYHDDALRKVICGPYEVATSGPRIVENFLDMAHFGFVHDGVLGDAEHADVRPYNVRHVEDETGSQGLLATGCFAWQPRTNSLSHQGSEVEYSYRVVRPLTAILTKIPQAQQGFREAISLHVQPIGEEASRVWIILAMTNFEHEDEALREFQDTIFLQDKPILENQSPKRLPLRGEISLRCDQMSLLYRRYLHRIGLRYGVERGSEAAEE